MNYSEVNKVLSSKLKNDELVEVFRSEIDELSTLANPVDLSSNLLCFENVVDFNVDGYKIIRNKDITDIVLCDKNDVLKFMNMIYRKEKLFPDSRKKFDIKNWNALFTQFMNENTPINVECAFDDAIDYYFGWIKKVNSNIVTMQCFDGGGNLFKDLVNINLDFVSQVTVYDKYTKLMSKYSSK